MIDRRLGTRARCLVVAALVTALFAFAACGKTSSTSSGGDTSATAPARGERTDKLVIGSFGGDWGDAIQKGFVDDFERETGIDVQLRSTVDPAKGKLAIRSGNAPPEDIVDYDFGTVTSLQREGLLAPIDYADVDAETLKQVPDNYRQQYGVGWGSFPIALCYDKASYEGRAPRTWADFWDVEQFPGKRGMLSWPVQPQPEFGLLADGVAVEDLYPIDVDRAVDKLAELTPEIPKFADSPATLQQQLIDGSITMAACYANRAERLIASGAREIAISYDDARLITDYFMVWKDAPNRENAMKFLAFVLKRQQQAKWAEIGLTTPVNDAAVQELPEAVRKQLPPPGAAFPSDDTWYTTETDGETNQQRVIDAWTDRIGS